MVLDYILEYPTKKSDYLHFQIVSIFWQLQLHNMCAETMSGQVRANHDIETSQM